MGNPASLQRLVDQGRLRLNSVNFVVVDEVDACMNKVETKMVRIDAFVFYCIDFIS